MPRIVEARLDPFRSALKKQKGKPSLKIQPSTTRSNEKFFRQLQSDFDFWSDIARDIKGCAWQDDDIVEGSSDIQSNGRPYTLKKLTDQIDRKLKLAKQKNYHHRAVTVMYGEMRIYNQFIEAILTHLHGTKKQLTAQETQKTKLSECYAVWDNDNPGQFCVPLDSKPEWLSVYDNPIYQNENKMRQDVIT